MRARAPYILSVFVVLTVAAAAQQAAPHSGVPAIEEIVARMEQAAEQNRARFQAYTVVRDYSLYGRGEEARTRVRAQVSFDPPDQKRFQIERSTGGQGEKVIRRVLEQEVAGMREAKRYQICGHNYDFTFVREEGAGAERVYVLEAQPKRNDGRLVRGHVWVDATNYLPRRVEGQLTKNPSFWVRDVHLTFEYGNFHGMWVQKATRATARVRMLGPYRMESRSVDLHTPRRVAATVGSGR